jgi:hypothetical protein
MVAVAQEQGAGFGAREAPGLREDALEEGVEVPLARERDPDLEELVKEPRPVDG